MSDWTDGVDSITYQQCPHCAARWYFRRGFCPQCGAGDPRLHRASGAGVVHATSQVMRAPTRSLAAQVPYTIVLIDAAEGFRMMAHGDADLVIDDHAIATFRVFDGALIPHFIKHPDFPA
jgi:uncharacterized OB-fold protein